jgi:hypothetical protein
MEELGKVLIVTETRFGPKQQEKVKSKYYHDRRSFYLNFTNGQRKPAGTAACQIKASSKKKTGITGKKQA